MKTLLVDGDNLFKIGFHGVKELFVDGNHIGGVYHFINTIRKQVDDNNYDKVIVFWDGENNSITRRKLYPDYKLNRRQEMNEHKFESYLTQKNRVKEYLEECFVRQVMIDNCESDDGISYYCKIAIDENKTIFSSDKDYIQLVDDTTSIYSPISKIWYKKGDKVKISEYEFPLYNVFTLKVLTGDKSDNVSGIYYLGEKTLVKFFPEILDKPTSVEDILTKAEILLKEDKENVVLKNLLSGKTKSGIFGEEFFSINKKIVDLKNPLITEEGKEIVELYYQETLDPEGRGYKNLIRMMTKDGFMKYLPKNDDAFVNFIRPFMKLTRKEKRKYKNSNN